MPRRVGLGGSAASAAPPGAVVDEVICHIYTAVVFGGSLAAHRGGTPDLHKARTFALKEGPRMARAAMRSWRRKAT